LQRNTCSAKRSANWDVHAARALSALERSSYSDTRYRLPLLADVDNLLVLKRQALRYRLVHGASVFTGIPPDNLNRSASDLNALEPKKPDPRLMLQGASGDRCAADRTYSLRTIIKSSPAGEGTKRRDLDRTLRTAGVEQDPKKLLELVSEINRCFEAREKRLAGKSEIKFPGQQTSESGDNCEFAVGLKSHSE
jgi:hypothetical protein